MSSLLHATEVCDVGDGGVGSFYTDLSVSEPLLPTSSISLLLFKHQNVGEARLYCSIKTKDGRWLPIRDSKLII